MTHRRATAAALMLCSLLLVTGCAVENQAGDAGRATRDPASGATGSSSPLPQALEISVTVEQHRVLPPPSRIKTTRGTLIKLAVTSDVPDTIHVHGYDVEQRVVAGQRTTIEWLADEVGIFEIEAHDNELQLGQLEVR